MQPVSTVVRFDNQSAALVIPKPLYARNDVVLVSDLSTGQLKRVLKHSSIDLGSVRSVNDMPGYLCAEFELHTAEDEAVNSLIHLLRSHKSHTKTTYNFVWKGDAGEDWRMRIHHSPHKPRELIIEFVKSQPPQWTLHWYLNKLRSTKACAALGRPKQIRRGESSHTYVRLPLRPKAARDIQAAITEVAATAWHTTTAPPPV